jgi:hypothetical protein
MAVPFYKLFNAIEFEKPKETKVGEYAPANKESEGAKIDPDIPQYLTDQHGLQEKDLEKNQNRPVKSNAELKERFAWFFNNP